MSAPRPHRHHGSRTVVGIASLLAVLLVAGCNSDKPTVSGFAIGNTRVVSVGDIVELRSPLRPDGSRQWRVSSYDSFYIDIAERPRVERNDAGELSLLIRAIARNPGSTELEISEVGAPIGREPRRLSFKIRIVD